MSLVSADTPCAACGHPRGDHDFDLDVYGERCRQCGCTATMALPPVITLDTEPKPLAADLIMAMAVLSAKMEASLFASLDHIVPPVVVKPGDHEVLLEIERLVAELWRRYSPWRRSAPLPGESFSEQIRRENADAEAADGNFRRIEWALETLLDSDEAFAVFPEPEHATLWRIRGLLRRFVT